jgi:hypothetical protein
MTSNSPIVVVNIGTCLAGDLIFLTFQKRPPLNLNDEDGENLGAALTDEIKAFERLPEYEHFSAFPHHSLFPPNRQIEIAVTLYCMQIKEEHEKLKEVVGEIYEGWRKAGIEYKPSYAISAMLKDPNGGFFNKAKYPNHENFVGPGNY